MVHVNWAIKAIVCAYAKQLVAHAQDKEWRITCNKHEQVCSIFCLICQSCRITLCSEYLYLPLLLKPFMLMKWNQPLKTLENLQCKKYSYLVLTFKANESTMRGCTKIVKASYRAFKALLARLIPKKKPKPKEKFFSGCSEDVLQCKLFRICFVFDIIAAKPY